MPTPTTPPIPTRPAPPARPPVGRVAAPPAPAPAAAPATPGDRFERGTPAPPDAAALERRLAASRAVFERKPEVGTGFRRVERDVVDAFMPRAAAALPALARRAGVELAANAAAERALLAAWPAPDRARYERVATLLDGQPLARLAWQILLLDRRLPGARRATDGATLLGAFERLERGPLAPALDRDAAGARLDRQYLVAGTVHEVAFPSSVNQSYKKTCTAATAQILMARHHPAEYVRLVAGLASPSGEVRMANGDVLARVAGTESWGPCPRTVSGRLFQAAVMDHGNHHDVYDDALDASDPAGRRYSGLSNQQFARVVQALTGLESRPWWADNGTTADDVIAQVRKSLAAGLPVPTSLRWGVAGPDGSTDGYHKVLVTAIDGERVRYLNPWGTEEAMALAAFRGRLEGINPIHPDWAFPRPAATSYAPPGKGPAAPPNCLVDVATGARRCI